jgi:hypothetical protein
MHRGESGLAKTVGCDAEALGVADQFVLLGALSTDLLGDV